MKRLLEGAAVAALAAGLAAPVYADGHADVASLSARVDALEAAGASNAPLSFGLGETTVSVYGFVRFEAFYDFDFAQGDLTSAGAIGDPAAATNGEFDTSVRVSRFGIRSATDTDIGKVESQLEFDLFGSGGSDSSSPNLRLRHANININDTVLVGQFWTNFMPLVHYPRTADFNGPVGITFARVPQLRYTFNTGSGFLFSASIEEANGGGSDPVATAAALYTGSNYSVRVAGLYSTFEDDLGGEEETYGVTVSGSYSPFAGTTISGTYTTGQGLGNLLIGGGARSVNGEANESDSYTVEITQDISEQFSVGVSYGREDYDLNAAAGTGLDIDQQESLFVNAFYTPVDNLTIGLEYSRGERSGNSGSFSADRVGTSVTFSF